MDESVTSSVPWRHQNPKDSGPRRRIPTEPLQVPPVEVLLRYKARLLDPISAVTLPGQTLSPTVYISDTLLVRNYGLISDGLARAAQGLATLRSDETVLGPTKRVRLDPLPDAQVAPDAWVVLQRYRAQTQDLRSGDVALEHLMTACADIGGVPFVGSHGIGGVPFVGSHGIGEASSQYGVPGLGGRTPVAWVGPAPARQVSAPFRRPVVAVLDTNVGDHPWLTDDIVHRYALVGGALVPVPTAPTDGTVEDPWEGVLDPDVGHATFIAGLIRQMAPDADVLSVAIMPTSGVVPQGDLLGALWALVARQQAAQVPGTDPGNLIDVVSLSMGYYHESPEDEAFDSQLLDPLQRLSELGVAVVASAGNDSTDRAIYPAAFTPRADGVIDVLDRNLVPLMSVGALNPDRTAALFSNAGEWVACYRSGASVVSCMPIDLDGGAQPSYEIDVPGYGVRANIDPDNFAGGFASWSGTSFAAPILAGQMVQTMIDHQAILPLNAVDRASCVGRGWDACMAQTGTVRP